MKHSIQSKTLNQAANSGIGIVNIQHMNEVLRRTKSFVSRVFSDEEQKQCNKRSRPEISYAMFYAGKAAALKALGVSNTLCTAVRHVHITQNQKGKYGAQFFGPVKELFDQKRFSEVVLSLSYTHTEAVACAVAIPLKDKTSNKASKDPMEELLQQFRDTRNML